PLAHPGRAALQPRRPHAVTLGVRGAEGVDALKGGGRHAAASIEGVCVSSAYLTGDNDDAYEGYMNPYAAQMCCNINVMREYVHPALI
ncbi:MAG: hypothetical protein KA790_04620, partial [Ottowia sp.]|nr:hypothetical protein [Ottowia sp.]